ncbi:hypothetical protein LDENG_00266260 [Lucifuga dentata]|nr:hypothetical protein LDENG_00266260 [Lucifuga dentata]
MLHYCHTVLLTQNIKLYFSFYVIFAKSFRMKCSDDTRLKTQRFSINRRGHFNFSVKAVFSWVYISAETYMFICVAPCWIS